MSQETAFESQPVPAVAEAVESERYHNLDAVRGFALLLGVVFHAGESFGRNNHYWAIVDSSPSDFLEWFRFACHSFRMELFFLIAGFFARLLIGRRGISGFIRNRLQRILVPLVVGWCVLYPLLVLLWLWGASVSGQLEKVGVPPEARDLPLAGLWVGFFLTGGFVEKFDLTHLWFLHQLLVIYALALASRGLCWRLGRLAAFSRWFDGKLDCVCRSPAGLPVLALVSVPILLCMNSWVVDTPKESLLPDLPVTALYSVFFLLGWGLHRRQELLPCLAVNWPSRLGIALALCAVLLAGGRLVDFHRLSPLQVWGIRLLHTILYTSMMWLFVAGFLGLAMRLFFKPRWWVRYTADASYWIYLAHLPLIVTLQIVVAHWPLPWPMKYGFIVLVAVPLLFGSYHWVVRSTWIGKALNGRRYPRQWPPRAGC